MFKFSFEGTKAEWDSLFVGMLAQVKAPSRHVNSVMDFPKSKLEAKPRSEAGASALRKYREEKRALRDGDSAKLYNAKKKALGFKSAFVTFKGTDAGALAASDRALFNDWCISNDIQVANIAPAYSEVARWQYTPFIKGDNGDILYADGPRGKDSALRGAPARVEHKPYHDKLDEVEIEILPRFSELQGVG